MSRQQNREIEKQNILMSAFYRYIAEQHIDNICADMDSLNNEIDRIDIPETLDDWFNQYIESINKENTRKKTKVKLKNISSRVAVILAVVFISIATLSLSVEAFRVQIYNLFSTDHNEYSNVRIREESLEDLKIPEWDNYYFPTYIPKGFYIEFTNELVDIKELKFTNGSGKFIYFSQTPNGTNVSLDTEGGEKSEVVIKDRKAILTVKEDKNILIWNNEEFSFYLSSNLEAEKLIIIAESLEKK